MYLIRKMNKNSATLVRDTMKLMALEKGVALHTLTSDDYHMGFDPLFFSEDSPNTTAGAAGVYMRKHTHMFLKNLGKTVLYVIGTDGGTGVSTLSDISSDVLEVRYVFSDDYPDRYFSARLMTFKGGLSRSSKIKKIVHPGSMDDFVNSTDFSGCAVLSNYYNFPLQEDANILSFYVGKTPFFDDLVEPQRKVYVGLEPSTVQRILEVFDTSQICNTTKRTTYKDIINGRNYVYDYHKMWSDKRPLGSGIPLSAFISVKGGQDYKGSIMCSLTVPGSINPMGPTVPPLEVYYSSLEKKRFFFF